MIAGGFARSRNGFRRLILRRPRLGCLLACGSYLLGTPLTMSGNPFLQLLAYGLLLLMVAAYQSLREYIEDPDHDRLLSRSYKEEDRRLSVDRELDDYESRLVKRGQTLARWIFGSIVTFAIWYQMLAQWQGFWMPSTPHQWVWFLFGAVALTWGLPTVIMAWIYKDDWNLPYPAWEDDD
jgi:hypothetical protein